MNLFHVIVLSIVEGITEFLPVSSTAHLIIASKILKLPQTEFLKVFEVVIQSGAILSVVFFYFKFFMIHKSIIKHLLISFIPTASVALFSYRIIKDVFFESLTLIALSLFVIGLGFIIFEKLVDVKKVILKKEISHLSLRDSFFIGLFQSLSIIPGVSRAGAVILGMMILGYKREAATVYSFLLSIPTIISAGLIDFYIQKEVIFSVSVNFWFLLIGFFTSFLFAWLSVRWLINFVKNHTLVIFGVYRVALAVILSLIILK
ncbi:MAG: undecaprenyl-diphosphate phosphatase [Patescibacteria group bacterium]|nr:undecaprenyl-diphosphate phosphatase [Patescibacteria group bacterium]